MSLPQRKEVQVLLNVIRDIRILGFLVGERNSHGDFYSVIAWCPECHDWHTHTGLKAVPERGLQLHRYPHCTRDSFWKEKNYDGYVIEIVGMATPEVLEDYQRTKPRGVKPGGWRRGENPIAELAA
jgi:hypothetical protein